MPDFLRRSRRDVPVIEDASLAALLEGAELPAGPVPELRLLAEALTGLKGQPASDELTGEAVTLAAFRNQFGVLDPVRRPSARKLSMRLRSLPVKASAAVAATVLGLGGIAIAAYAGSLPAGLQRLAHDIIGAPAPGPRPAPRPSHPGPALTGHHARTSPSLRPHPAPTPHSPGKPSALPTPHGSGKPSVLPTPHGSGKPSVLPTPHGPGAPDGAPTGRPPRNSWPGERIRSIPEVTRP
jgi:hypothetical protein